MKKIILIPTIIILACAVFAYCLASKPQEKKSLKEQAQEAFRNEHYDEAIALLYKAVKETPNDPEIWYYLGWFYHYRAYDSRPLKGYDFSYQQKIFDYLSKAISLSPTYYGDAIYFYTAECCSAALNAKQDGDDVEKLKYFYKKAYDKGGFPAWSIEFGKNFMNTCEENAILFVGGDFDFNICTYLQLHENYRTDLTIIPITFVERPWYVKFLRDGLEGGVRKVNINLTDRQIMDFHPYKWMSTPIYIPVSQAMKTELRLNKNFQFKWIVEPDLVEPDRIDSKRMTGEDFAARTYMSPRRAMLLQIVEDNFSERPIHFSNFVHSAGLAGLSPYLENRGLTSRLLPIETANTKHANVFSMYEKFLTPENLKDFKTLKTLDQPRISGVVVSGYYRASVQLARHYKQTNQTKKLENLIDTFKTYLAIGIDKEYENDVLRVLQSR